MHLTYGGSPVQQGRSPQTWWLESKSSKSSIFESSERQSEEGKRQLAMRLRVARVLWSACGAGRKIVKLKEMTRAVSNVRHSTLTVKSRPEVCR